MRIEKRTALWAVLFCGLLLSACAAPKAPPVFPSRILWKDDYSMNPGESAMMRLYKMEDDGSERRITFSRSGPVKNACSHGCGSLAAQLNANPGKYRIEAENSLRPGIASTVFTVKANDFWIWSIADADKPASFSDNVGGDIGPVTRGGAYRIDPFAIGTVDMLAGLAEPKPVRETVPAHLPKGHREARN